MEKDIVSHYIELQKKEQLLEHYRKEARKLNKEIKSLRKLVADNGKDALFNGKANLIDDQNYGWVYQDAEDMKAASK